MAKPNEEGVEINLSGREATDEEIKELLPPEDKKVDKGDEDEDDDDDKPSGEKGDEDDELTSGAKTSEEELETGSEAERKEIRERKKTDRLNQRQRQRQKIETLERQLANALSMHQNMSNRVAQLESSNQGTEYARLQNAEQQLVDAENALKNIIADASVKGDGVRVAEATQGLLDVRERKGQVAFAKNAMETEARRPKSQPLDNEVVNQARDFMTRNSWYKGPKSTDQDSRILSSIDNSMTAEGWDPKSPTYWQELETRAKKYLAHRFDGQKSLRKTPETDEQGHNAGLEQRRPKSPVAAGNGSGNSEGGKGGGNQYRLTGERVKAMKEAGFWEDPKKRASMIKRYQDLDRANSNN